MGLKKYIGASIIFIAVVAGYVYSIISTDYNVAFLDKSYTYPIAIWIIVPLVILFIASLAHMLFYNFKIYLFESSLKKDKSNIIKLFKSKLLKKDENIIFKTPMFQELGEIISQLELDIKDEARVQNVELEVLLRDLNDIKNGKYVATNYKLGAKNEISIMNNINKINEQPDWSIEILKKSSDYSEKEIETAFKKCCEDKCMTTIKKVLPNLKLNKEMLFLLLEKDSKDSEFGLNKDELLGYIEQVELNRQEFVEIAQLYSNSSLVPDDIIKLFEELSNKNELALDSYVYILFVYEMIDQIKDIFNATTNEELVPFKALLELRDTGKHYNLDSICYLK